MKNLKTKIITALLLLAMVSGAVAQEKWEYATVSYSVSFKKIKISANGDFESKPAEGSKDPYDLNPVFKVLNQMQDKGWEVYESTTYAVEGVIYFLRKRQN